MSWGEGGGQGGGGWVLAVLTMVRAAHKNVLLAEPATTFRVSF